MAGPPPSQGGGGRAGDSKHLPGHELPVRAFQDQREPCESERDERQHRESTRKVTPREGPPESSEQDCDHEKSVDDVHYDLPCGCPACRIESAVVRPTRSVLTCHRRRDAALS